MARQKIDPEVAKHLEWLGFVRPTGLVVSALALVKAGAILNRHDSEGQDLLRGTVPEGGEPTINNFRGFAEQVLRELRYCRKPILTASVRTARARATSGEPRRIEGSGGDHID